jgi:hypothetical protein
VTISVGLLQKFLVTQGNFIDFTVLAGSLFISRHAKELNRFQP